MDNNIKTQNINDTAAFINNTYDSLSYFDLYGNSVIIFIFMSLFVFLVYSYCKIMQTKEIIADDWINQRCKPQNIPFAGFINRPEGTTAFQYTSDNFQYCVQDILKNITGQALQPFQYMIQTLTNTFGKFADSIQKTREATNKLRNGIKDFTEDILNRILNVMIPIQTMFISVLDTFQKIQGIMTSGLYTMLGSYYALQSLMGAIVELIIKLLTVLVAIIVGLWVMPFTWPAAASMSAVFLAISIPLSIIVYFMSEVLHVKSSKIPKLRCFDKKTRIYLDDGTFKHIQDIKLNDVLLDKSTVTAKITVTAEDLDMYNLNGIIVSESHIVNYFDKWIPVKYHPNARRINNYDEPYLYCLNTTSKTIILNDIVFTDWDEIYGDTLHYICEYINYAKIEKIHEGFAGDTKVSLKVGEVSLKDVSIGDYLSTGGIVYGIVEMNDYLGNNKPYYNLLVSNRIFKSGTNIHSDYNSIIDTILDSRKILSKEYV